jgi:predicted lipoprotein
VTIRARAWSGIGAVIVAWLAIARPWTIRPIAGEPGGPFDAAAYVTRIWEARAVPAIRSRAISFAAYETQHTTRATPVSLDGTVVDVDTRSRVGVATVDLNPPDGRADARLLIGPALRGTALRDALEFIQFTDFTNQIQFAAVANALNDRALLSALKNVNAASLAGRRIRVIGVAWRDSIAPDAVPFVVPVQLSIGERP